MAMPKVSQQRLLVILFSAICTCIALILIYMAISELLRRRSIRQSQLKPEIRQANPLAWKSKP
jgi:hypothetical protein